MSALPEVAASVDEELAPYVIPEVGEGRFEGLVDDSDRAFVVEVAYEGHLLHHGETRLFSGMDADLRLLAGDALYALGLARLARTGDLPAVSELADVIALSARTVVEERADLRDSLWEATAAALSAARGPGARAASSPAFGGPREQ